MTKRNPYIWAVCTISAKMNMHSENSRNTEFAMKIHVATISFSPDFIKLKNVNSMHMQNIIRTMGSQGWISLTECAEKE
jgi:hypothetical protein